ncbi:MAG: O-antigen ligase family protein [Bacteroidota bacterium]
MDRVRAMFPRLRLQGRNDMLVLLAVVVTAAASGIALGFHQTNLVLIAFAAVAGALLFVITVKRPAIGAALILFLAPLEGSVSIGGNSAVKLISLFCMLVFAVRVLDPANKILLDRGSALAICFVLWAFVTLAWSPDPRSSISDWVSIALQSVLYVLLVNFVLSGRDLKLALWGHVLGGTILAIGFTQRLIALDFLRNVDIMGFGINLGTRLIGLNVVLAVILYQLETNRLARFVLILAAGISSIGAVIGLSRGTWVGVAASLGALGAVYYYKGKMRPRWGQIIKWSMAVMLLVFILSSFVLDAHGIQKMTTRFIEGFTFSDAGGGRFEIWSVARDIFVTSPIWGHGVGAFHDEFMINVEKSGLSNYFHVNEAKGAHNAFVLTGVELGLVGIGLLVALLAYVFRKVWKLTRLNPPNLPTLSSVWALTTFLVLSMLVDSAVDRKYLWYGLALVTLLIRYPSTRGLTASQGE